MKTHYLLNAFPHHSWVWGIEKMAQKLPTAIKERLMVQTAVHRALLQSEISTIGYLSPMEFESQVGLA